MLAYARDSRLLAVALAALVFFALVIPAFTIGFFVEANNPPQARTFFHLHTDRQGNPFATSSPFGLTPIQIKNAYNLTSNGGNQTIAIIDAYDCPTVENDFAVFSAQFGLPTGNFEKHKMASNIRVDSSWALEISLDVQWAHAIAPNAKILLVEARSSSLSDLLSAVAYAKSRLDVVAVSMSWGSDEFSSESSFDSYFTGNQNITYFASSGDNGAGVSWPAVSPYVIGVGGTTLTFSSNGSVASETAWSGSGGGISVFETAPSYQVQYNISVGNGKRTVPDVSYNGNPSSGFSVYNTTPYNGQTGWFVVGGTSAGTPQWAAIHTLGLSVSNSNLYKDAKSNSAAFFRDITSGSNGAFFAGTGYDLVTGLGSPLTYNFNQTQTFYSVSGFSVLSGGTDYTTPAVIISGGGGSGASGVAHVSNGIVYRVDLLAPGSGYVSVPTVILNDPNPRATGAIIKANIIAP